MVYKTEAKWLGKGDVILWLKKVDFEAKEFWTAEIEDTMQNEVKLRRFLRRAPVRPSQTHPASRHCANRVASRAPHLKLHRLHGQYDGITIVVAYPATSNSGLYLSDTRGSLTKYTTRGTRHFERKQ